MSEAVLYPHAPDLYAPPAPDIATQHKQAFRTAFDTLKELYPPENTAEYWTFAAERVSAKYSEQKDNRLAVFLLKGVLEYMEDVNKQEQEKPNVQN